MCTEPTSGVSEKRALPVDFWEGRYQESHTPWELNEPAPPFVHLMQTRAAGFPPGKMAVLGSGRGQDAGLFGHLGFEVTGFDYAPSAVRIATEQFGDVARFEQADIFKIPESCNGTFDYVLEHTCFCALHPDLREDYVGLAARLLRPGGRFIALLWAHNEWGGPPYRVSRQEIFNLFSPAFDLTELLRTPHSHPSRRNEEYLAVFTRKNG